MNSALFGLAVFSVTLNALAQIALRKTMLTIGAVPSSVSGVPSFFLSIGLNFWFIGGMACYAISIGAWMAVLRKAEVSFAYPLLSIGYLITAIIGYFFMGEHVNIIRITGIAIICFGIIVVSRSA
ncbi:4-amino-4-deoxy-L-arabinose transferase [Komagataeibacter xylinus]|nr:4-amino-4-deoxy-L-arabinose transferase [Komagataeibacter xylinus]